MTVFFAQCLLFLFSYCSFSFPSAIKHGEGNQFQKILWHPEYVHDNFAGGLRLRKMFESFCADASTTPLPPFCSPSAPSMKHNRERDSVADENTLHIVLLQEPLSWMLDRLSQTQHGQHRPHALTESSNDKLFAALGRDYLHFLSMSGEESGDAGDGSLLQSALSCFEGNMMAAAVEGGNIQAQYSDKNKSSLAAQATHGSFSSPDKHTSQYEQSSSKHRLQASLVIVAKLRAALSRPNVLVLVLDYLPESLQVLNYAFNTPFFRLTAPVPSPASSSASSTSQVGSPLAVKNAAAQLELHQMLYQGALQHFLVQYFAMQTGH